MFPNNIEAGDTFDAVVTSSLSNITIDQDIVIEALQFDNGIILSRPRAQATFIGSDSGGTHVFKGSRVGGWPPT